MRTSKRIIFALLLGATPVATSGFAFDGVPVNQDSALTQPGSAVPLKRGATSGVDGRGGVTSYAAEAVKQFRLGRQYARGEGVEQNDERAFDTFSFIANTHAEDSPYAPQAEIVANAFVALGRYYLSGIPNKIEPDRERAREMFSYAASYFGNADAQYDLARFYLKNSDASRDDVRYGARWLLLAAQKNQHEAQALLGQMLFNGDQLPRQAARGLMWLMLACDGAPEEIWIKDSYNRALSRATTDDRTMALQMVKHWLRQDNLN
jgi:TPR repeat protein